MIRAEIQIDFDEAFSSLSDSQRQEFLDEWVEDYDYHPEPFNLDDPVRLLGIITSLRSRGYTVEPA